MAVEFVEVSPANELQRSTTAASNPSFLGIYRLYMGCVPIIVLVDHLLIFRRNRRCLHDLIWATDVLPRG